MFHRNNAILEYLQIQGLESTAKCFTEEAQFKTEKPITRNHLEKKWTSLVRLQKKVIELEEQCKYYEKELETIKTNPNIIQKSQHENSSTERLLVPHAPTELQGHRSPITCIDFHPLYTIIATASEDYSIRLWDYETGTYEQSIRLHSSSVNCVAFDYQGKYLLSCSSDTSIRVYDIVNNYQCIQTLYGHEHSVTFAQFVPNQENWIVSCSKDNTIKLWEISSGACIRTFVGHENWVKKVICNHSGTILATCSADQTIKLWNIADGNCTTTLRGHFHVIECLAFSTPLVNQYCNNTSQEPCCYLLSGSRDKTVLLWNVQTGELVSQFVGHENWIRDCLFHPTSGKHIVTVSDDKTLRIWDITTKTCVQVIKEAHSHFVTCLSTNITKANGVWTTLMQQSGETKFPSSNGAVWATGSVDQTVKVWKSKKQ